MRQDLGGARIQSRICRSRAGSKHKTQILRFCDASNENKELKERAMPRHATTIFSEVRRINERRYSCAVQAYRLVLRTCSQKRATAEQSACGSLVQARSRSHLIICNQNIINWQKNLGFSTLIQIKLRRCKKGYYVHNIISFFVCGYA